MIKSLMITVFVALCAFVLPAGAQSVGSSSENSVDADDGHAHDLQIDSIVVFKSFEVAAPVHRLFALIRKDGHAINRPFVLELRGACRGSFAESAWASLRVGDQESLCGVDPATLAYDSASGAVVLEYLEPDADFYKEQIGRKASKIKQRCLKERKVLRLPVARLCSAGAAE